MQKIYMDYTQVGGNSFQLGFMDIKNLKATYFMTIMWYPYPHIIVNFDSIFDDECYSEITHIIDTIRLIGNSSKDSLSKQLENLGYVKNPLAK